MTILFLSREDLVATSGATQGLCLLLQLLTSRGDIVFVEDPTYFAALKIVQADTNLEVAAGTIILY